MKKKISIIFLVFILFYLAVSFVFLDFNFFNWGLFDSMIGRMITLGSIAIITIWTILIYDMLIEK